tara:strand:+ start:242 stop:1018 length:777 start_codon:yes stop_codon:yes gene_type:complete
MRITYRNANNKLYWKNRWNNIDADKAMTNENKYPLKFSNLVVKDKNQKILEAGCGAGRILRRYHDLKYDIIGIEFIKEAVDKLKKVDQSLNVDVGNILNLKFDNNHFDIVLAFGLYHNFEPQKLDQAVSETYRVMKKGAKICASFRADNLQELIVDFIRKDKNSKNEYFHKLNLKKREFINLFEKHNFKVEDVHSVQNMPFLYKFKFFRAKDQKNFNENVARIEGYKLSPIGNLIQNFLINYFPDQFCNIYVLIAQKN